LRRSTAQVVSFLSGGLLDFTWGDSGERSPDRPALGNPDGSSGVALCHSVDNYDQGPSVNELNDELPQSGKYEASRSTDQAAVVCGEGAYAMLNELL
jgi:hypothetical protein